MSVSKNWGQNFWATTRKKYYFISQPYLPYKKKQKKVEFDYHLRHRVNAKPLNILKDQTYS